VIPPSSLSECGSGPSTRIFIESEEQRGPSVPFRKLLSLSIIVSPSSFFFIKSFYFTPYRLSLDLSVHRRSLLSERIHSNPPPPNVA